MYYAIYNFLFKLIIMSLPKIKRQFPLTHLNKSKQCINNTKLQIKPSNAKVLIDKLKKRKMFCLQVEEENHKKFYKKVQLVQNKEKSNNIEEQSLYNKVDQIEYENMKKQWSSKIKDIRTDFIDNYKDSLSEVLNLINDKESSISNENIINDYNERKNSYYNNKILKEILNDDLSTKKKERTITIDYENIINVSYIKKEESISNTSSNSNNIEPILKFTDESNSNSSSEITVRDYNTESIIDTSDSCNELFM